jgi:hypothetical protein
VGIPLLGLLLMAKADRKLSRTRFRLGFLYSEYKDKTFYWEIVTMSRKVAMFFIAEVFFAGSSLPIKTVGMLKAILASFVTALSLVILYASGMSISIFLFIIKR